MAQGAQHILTPGYFWEDLQFPATAINPPGAASDPDWDSSNGGWLFDAGSTEVLYLIAQMSHTWVEGTDLEPHVHWEKSTSAAGNVRWQLRYEWARIDAVRTAITTINATALSTPQTDPNTADHHLITSLGTISGTDSQISDMLVMRIERTGAHGDDTYGADARLLEFDIHYQRDFLGSYREYIKRGTVTP